MRKIYIDVIRIIGAFMVLFHGGSSGQWEREAMSLPMRIVYMTPATIVPSAVPLFMMVSGSLLLKREDSIRDIWNKRVIRIMLLILVLTILHYGFDIFNGRLNVSEFVYRLIDLEKENIVYWFMYWWLSFSIMLFCYQQIAKKLDKEHISYIITFYLLFNTIIPIVNLFLDSGGLAVLKFSSHLSLPLFLSSGFFYPFLGYYIDNRCGENKMTNNTFLLIFIIIICSIVTMCLNIRFKINDANMPPRNVFTPVITACIYLVIKNVFESVEIKVNTVPYKLITFFGSNTIGVYAFQVLFGMMFNGIIRDFFYQVVHIKKVASFLYMIVAFISLSVVTAVLKKVPVFRRALT